MFSPTKLLTFFFFGCIMFLVKGKGNCEMSDSGIFCKIDWFSAVFESCSISDILRWLSIDHETDDFFSNSFSRALGYDTQVNYAFEGVTISVSFSLINHYAVENADITVFDFIFDRLRLDISGSGLDNLRDKWLSLGKKPGELDDYLRLLPELDRGQMHVTRCDFAFDLIDWHPEFLDSVISYCSDVSSSGSSRLPVATSSSSSRPGGFQFSVRTGDQKTVYIGSPRSDKMLRIYDKRMQLTNDDGVWLKSVDHSDCSSWVRIELQTRNRIANGLCYGVGDFLSIFRYIYDTYSFRDLSSPSNKPVVVKFWDDLFLWDELPPIKQNLHSAPLESVYDRKHRFVFGTAFSSIATVIAVDGWEHFFDELCQQLHTLQTVDSFSYQKKWASLLLSLHVAAQKFDNRIALLSGVSVDNGEVQFKR